MSNVIRVMIIDDHPLMRKGIAQLLSLDSKFEIVVEAKNGEEGIQFANQYKLDLILLDFNMHGISGLETLKRLRSQGNLTKIIILTVSDNKQDVIAMINHGANGYFLKDSDASILLTNINRVLNDELVLSENLVEYLNDLDEEDNIREKLNELTKREKQILQEIAKGQSNKEISINLHISEGTVKVHVKSLLKKLQAKSRVEAAIVYLQQPK
ncbi:nitrate/nitrite response regulator [Psychromonas sp. PRT-SC03]|nr:nitrate/nitrite response regulator [Psychromonas sp. PRT-SC03]